MKLKARSHLHGIKVQSEAGGDAVEADVEAAASFAEHLAKGHW